MHVLEQPHITPVLMERDQTTGLNHSPVENHRLMGGGRESLLLLHKQLAPGAPAMLC